MSVPVKDQLGELVMSQQQELAITKAHVERLKDNIGQLLKLHAQYSRPCRGCSQPLWFVYMQKTGKYQVYEVDGTPHWGKCPAQADFKKQEAK